MGKGNKNVNSLLAAIKRQSPVEPLSAPTGQKESPRPAPASGNQASPAPNNPPILRPRKHRIGSKATIWMHDNDRKLVRELSAWLAGQGVRPSDSMVIRAALRFVKTGGSFLEAYRQASAFDGRLKREATEST